MKVQKLKEFLDSYLRIKDIDDYSMNGLQVGQPKKDIRKVALSVDASLEFFKKAAKGGYNFLIVHHGLFWGENFPITGIHLKRFKVLIDNELNLYAAHLPLDLHPEIGHNAEMVRILGLDNIQPFGIYKGIPIGFKGAFKKPKSINEIRKLFDKMLGKYELLQMGKKAVSSIAIVSGGAASLIPEAIESNIDLYVTGEPSHSMYHFIKEAKLNVIFGGHYKTETFGLLALQKLIEKKFHFKTKFFDIPTGY